MGKIAYLFPGQGSQCVGMGADFYSHSPLARERYDQAETYFDFSLKTISFQGTMAELIRTHVTQPAIFVLSVIIHEELKKRGCKPDMVAGHSLGEYSALVAAGALSFEDGLKLVKLRARAMQSAAEQNPGTMTAVVGLDADQVEEVITASDFGGICQVANYNSPAQIVISGDVVKVQAIMPELKKAGAKMVVELTVGGAFHSALMQPASEELATALAKTAFQAPVCPIFSNVTGTATQDPETIRTRLLQQLTAPVRWTDTLFNMQKAGARRFVEVGPGKVLQGLAKRTLDKVTITGISTVKDLEQLSC